jgi:hypothetical protein
MIPKNGKKGIRLFKEDFICAATREECYKSVARKRLVETVID